MLVITYKLILEGIRIERIALLMAFMGIWVIPVPVSSQPPSVRCHDVCMLVQDSIGLDWHSVNLQSLYCRSFILRSPRPKEKTWICLVKFKSSFQVVTLEPCGEDSRDDAPWEELPRPYPLHPRIMIPPPEAEEMWFGLVISPISTILSPTLLKKHAPLFAKFINSTCLQVPSRCHVSLSLLARWWRICM